MSTNRYQVVDPILSNVAIGYTNDNYIADLLLPDNPRELPNRETLDLRPGAVQEHARKARCRCSSPEK